MYEIEVLGDDPNWDTGSISFDINDAGAVVGRGSTGGCGVAWIWTPSGGFQPFGVCSWTEGLDATGVAAGAFGRPGLAAVLAPGSSDFVRLPVPIGLRLSNGHDINDAGTVVANGRTSGGGIDIGYAWTRGPSGYNPPVQLPRTGVIPWKINNEGTIIGWTTAIPQTGLVWRQTGPGVYADQPEVLPDIPGGTGRREPRGITDGGLIGGFAVEGATLRAVIWDVDGPHLLDQGPFLASTVNGVGTTEVLVGGVQHADDGNYWAALWVDRQLISLRERIMDAEAWPGGISATAANADGWVAAYGTNADGRVLPMVLRPLGCSIADLDLDGDLTLFDFLAFQNLFATGDPLADFDGDGDLTLFDFLAFQNAFDAGCP
ncbi:MAG: GC-type dockerin domain-anchored protein [Planctomycetota bacterium]